MATPQVALTKSVPGVTFFKEMNFLLDTSLTAQPRERNELECPVHYSSSDILRYSLSVDGEFSG